MYLAPSLRSSLVKAAKMLNKARAFLFLLLCIFGNSNANELNIRDGFYRLSYDSITLPGNEVLGLVGTNYLLNFDNSYLGLGVYSAADGQRGGFFIGGLEFGRQFKLDDDLYLDGGLFIGGGGGGSAPQGGGLVVRPHFSVVKDIGKATLGLGASKVRFPNGEIDSNQMSLHLDIPFGFVYKSADSDRSDNDDVFSLALNSGARVGWQDNYIASTYQHYSVDSGVNNKNVAMATDDMDLIGFEYGVKLDKGYYAYLETAGAAGGTSDGYAELLGGIGYGKTLSPNYGVNIKAAFGSSGGGNVDTGGGLIHKQSIGFYARPFDKVSLAAEVGRIGTFDGSFKATTTKLSLQYPFKLLSSGSLARKDSNYDYTSDALWNIGAVNQSYLGSDTLRKSGSDESMQLLGIKLNRYLDSDTYLIGQALASYQGNAGGYAVGLVGIGKEFDVTERLSLSAEMSAGVAGGGGIATGGGAIVQPMLGLTYKLDSDVGLQASVGRLKAINNGGSTSIVELGIRYQFKTVE